MPDQGFDVDKINGSREIEELRAVLKIKDDLIQSLNTERTALENRIKELGQKYMEMLELYETLRHQMAGMPTLEEVVRMQSIIMKLEQKLKMKGKE
jgi:predicted RNase H-like nuclease (RuvC/YqgF family)